jgi:hypothetical protein
MGCGHGKDLHLLDRDSGSRNSRLSWKDPNDEQYHEDKGSPRDERDPAPHRKAQTNIQSDRCHVGCGTHPSSRNRQKRSAEIQKQKHTLNRLNSRLPCCRRATGRDTCQHCKHCKEQHNESANTETKNPGAAVHVCSGSDDGGKQSERDGTHWMPRGKRKHHEFTVRDIGKI